MRIPLPSALLQFSNWSRSRTRTALSICVDESSVRWVCGRVATRGGVYRFESIHASGRESMALALQTAEGDLNGELMTTLLRRVIGSLGQATPKPEGVVIGLPDNWVYFGEIQTRQDDSEQSIRFQIEDLLDTVVGDAAVSMAYDWQTKAMLNDGSMSLAVAGIDQRYIAQVQQACKQLKLECFGVTANTLAGLNGYLQTLRDQADAADGTILLHGQLWAHRIALRVYSEGLLLHESADASEEGFSAVQAVSAMEKLVSIWSRDHAASDALPPRLILGGELMASKGVEVIVRRSAVLSALWVNSPPRRELQAHWHEDVMPFGALEALPCA
ncbi:hypothetical protein NQT62_02515 [Limnobacter humi]|uniref:Uncharacterized protein n=1 Tax=Limnobacter humi TaxID=1778671 RepID=A0ABT1WEZ7_9BURK|nr:hypothetical protein [Limnobacter humi]MCQ8895312.1 hypothetical protein [Limnobacter humi]